MDQFPTCTLRAAFLLSTLHNDAIHGTLSIQSHKRMAEEKRLLIFQIADGRWLLHSFSFANLLRSSPLSLKNGKWQRKIWSAWKISHIATLMQSWSLLLYLLLLIHYFHRRSGAHFRNVINHVPRLNDFAIGPSIIPLRWIHWISLHHRSSLPPANAMERGCSPAFIMKSLSIIGG